MNRQIPHTLVLEHVSPATRLLEKRRQMFEVQEALEQQKQDYARKVRDLFGALAIAARQQASCGGNDHG